MSDKTKLDSKISNLDARVLATIDNQETDAFLFLVMNLDKYKFMFRDSDAYDVHDLILKDLDSQFSSINKVKCSKYLNGKLVFSKNIASNYLPIISGFICSSIILFIQYILVLHGSFDIVVNFAISALTGLIYFFIFGCLIEHIVSNRRLYRIKNFTRSDLL